MYTVSEPEDVLRVEGLLNTFNANTVSGMLTQQQEHILTKDVIRIDSGIPD